MKKGYILTDIKGTRLDSEDRELIEHPALFAILLFARNYESPQQLLTLTKSIHQLNPKLLIAVDQEGGRVQRFCQGFTNLKPMSYWGALYDRNPVDALAGLRQQTAIMVTELQACGVQLSLAPVLDIDYKISQVIGERSFHQTPDIVSHLAKCVVDTMHCYKMPTIGKHFPGHGGVALDSHCDLPIDQRTWTVIWNQDLKPYRALLTDLDAIMPAHIVYSKVDSHPAGFSSYWISKVLRQEFNYQGLVITDDLSMAGAATMGTYLDRAGFALEAGCDILTLCNNREGLFEVIDNIDNYGSLASTQRILNYTGLLN